MEHIAHSLTELIGHTPLLEASRFLGGAGGCRLLAKLDDGGYLKVVGKESRGSSGRPSRLIQIDLEG